MPLINVVVEGLVDRFAVERLAAAAGLDIGRVVVTNGKDSFNRRLPKYNAAARHSSWLAVRDSDRDGDDCPVTLRSVLLDGPQSPGLSLRLAVRTIEAWLLADAEMVVKHFSVPANKVPGDPEQLERPKHELVHSCRSSRRRDVRAAMVPPDGKGGTGPDYTGFVGRYVREAWRPTVAAQHAPSLARALRELDVMVGTGRW